MQTTAKGARLTPENTFGLCLLLAGLAASSCAPHDAGLGAAVRHNVALHVIDPRPSYAGQPIAGGSGARAAAAQERYRTGTVKPPQTIQTTDSPASRNAGERP